MRQSTNLAAEVTWQPPRLEHPDQAAELIAHVWFNQPPQAFRELAARVAPDNLPAILATTREQLGSSLSPADLAQLSYDPFGLTHLPDGMTAGASSLGQDHELFASADGTFRLVFVQAGSDLSSCRKCVTWLKAVKAQVAGFRGANPAFKNVAIHYTGRPAFVAEIAGGRERDMTRSVLGTMGIITLLFWWAHRRWRPLLWLLALLALILGGTLGLGGLIFGTLNVVSTGFAAILPGLAADYGLVLYQEAVAAPDKSPGEIRRAVAPGIFWSAVTTAGVFVILNLSRLPGLAQLGFARRSRHRAGGGRDALRLSVTALENPQGRHCV